MTDNRYRIGIDTGGTFIDVAIVDRDGSVAAAKGLAGEESPLPRLLGRAATTIGMDVGDLLAQTSSVTYGTTAGLNALLTRSGSKTGLLTTRGHEDAILIGRVHQKVAGLTPQEMTDVAHLAKPAPIVPRWLIHGIHERIDADGRVVVSLDRDGVTNAARALLEAGCEAIAVSFLWSFRNDVHERQAAAAISAHFPDAEVTLSVDAAPVQGEYERTSTTVMSAHIAAAVKERLGDLENELRDLGFGGELYVMQSNGGFATVAEASRAPAVTLGSGPAGGVMAATHAVPNRGSEVISTDMGGTSFDVGLIVDGHPELDETPVIGQLHLASSTIRVRSIGAGGGSIAWLDDFGGLHVGPDSAGADPGPACYGRGGTRPTVTDADLLLGRLNPSSHPDPDLELNRQAAEKVIGKLADLLGVDAIRAAVGIVRVADGQMADLIRKVTLERGRDPRRFTLVGFGGAGPVHVGSFAPDVGVAGVVVPRSAAVFSAQGLAASHWRKLFAASHLMRVPLEAKALDEVFGRLLERASAEFLASGVPGELVVRRTMDFRYSRQTHVVRVRFDGGSVNDDSVDEAVGRFAQEYERIFGPGTGYQEAGIEVVALGLEAETVDAGVTSDETSSADTTPGPTATRKVYFDAWLDVPVHRVEHLAPGSLVIGPAVVDEPATTLVVHPGQQVTMGDAGELHLTWNQIR